jgi:hypothetical protein
VGRALRSPPRRSPTGNWPASPLPRRRSTRAPRTGTSWRETGTSCLSAFSDTFDVCSGGGDQIMTAAAATHVRTRNAAIAAMTGDPVPTPAITPAVAAAATAMVRVGPRGGLGCVSAVRRRVRRGTRILLIVFSSHIFRAGAGTGTALEATPPLISVQRTACPLPLPGFPVACRLPRAQGHRLGPPSERDHGHDPECGDLRPSGRGPGTLGGRGRSTCDGRCEHDRVVAAAAVHRSAVAVGDGRRPDRPLRGRRLRAAGAVPARLGPQRSGLHSAHSNS